MNNFYSDFISGKFDDNKRSTEEEKVVMDKTVSVSNNPSEEKIKVDHLDSEDSLENEILKSRKAERDVSGTVPLPLFRFEEKQRKEIDSVIEQFIEISIEEVRSNTGGIYTPLFGFINIFKKGEIKHAIDLTISRNKEVFNTSAKEFIVEMITCYIDKKLKIKFDIPEDHAIDEKVDVEYTAKKENIHDTFIKLFNNVNQKMQMKQTGTEKDIKIYMGESAGDENHGTGFSIYLKYDKLIDYTNHRRGKEDYGSILGLLDDEFVKSLENNDDKEEQISINEFERSNEAIADGMSENSDESEDSETEDDPENPVEDDENIDDSENETDDFMGDSGDGEDEGEDGEFGDDSGSSDDYSDSKPKEPKVSGQNPFADINSKEKISTELNMLKDQIDKVLIKMGQFKSNVVVKKLVELNLFIEDALKNSYTVPLQDSLIRYSLYVTQFDDLISALSKYFERKSTKTQ